MQVPIHTDNGNMKTSEMNSAVFPPRQGGFSFYRGMPKQAKTYGRKSKAAEKQTRRILAVRIGRKLGSPIYEFINIEVYVR
jgi:hypothetical protein